MEINVLEKSKNKLVFELKGSDHTFCNLLKEELRQQSDIDVVTYVINHPLVGIPKFFLETKKDDPKKSLEKAVKSLESKNKEFLKLLK